MLERRIIQAILCASLFSLAPVIASASVTLERDFQQPVDIEADREFLDMREGIFQVQGNVIIRQGSMTIRADELEIEGFSEAGGDAERFVAKGSPATYEQEIDVGIFVTASAEEIIYDAVERILIMQGNAELFQGGNVVRAARITYNLEAQQIEAERGESDDERVRNIFQPRERTNNENNGANNNSNSQGNR